MDKTSRTDAPEDPSKIGQSAPLNLVDLSKDLNRAEHNFHKSRDTQGVLGSSYDWMKNNLGGSYETGSWLARRWSNVLNYDMGSEAIQKNIDRTKQLVASGDLDKVARASEIADGRINLKATNTAKEYNNDQRLGVNLLADTATFAAVALTRGKGGRDVVDLMVRGAVVKSGLKAVDGSYSKPLDDAATGAFIGVMTPIAGALGKGTGMVAETAPVIRTLNATFQPRTVSAVRFGTEGAVLGYMQQTSSSFEQKRVDGERAGEAFWRATLDSVANPTGAALGFVGGGLGGFLLGKTRIAKIEVPETPNPPGGPHSPLAPASNSAEVGLQIPRSPNGPLEPIRPSSGSDLPPSKFVDAAGKLTDRNGPGTAMAGPDGKEVRPVVGGSVDSGAARAGAQASDSQRGKTNTANQTPEQAAAVQEQAAKDAMANMWGVDPKAAGMPTADVAQGTAMAAADAARRAGAVPPGATSDAALRRAALPGLEVTPRPGMVPPPAGKVTGEVNVRQNARYAGDHADPTTNVGNNVPEVSAGAVRKPGELPPRETIPPMTVPSDPGAPIHHPNLFMIKPR
ncbi:MAG: hypothetical protein C0473_02770 [Cyanobacteria bacterium DS3.002]|nr:hypothetical protein [Cyanobacteria bacterium DS3.002]MBA4049739.1 hypothetical protein [Cyanobacteria bacterium DS2.008]MBA4073408.1 hypothetical protein [Cyanobacteria bacterium PR.023]